ncbi:hypothetical protein DPMN_162256 [Dreissena polymorpha]|uniref:Uncharacterized protein n=1 Tax=Dreissena polymorpha TaxID=45954 RepID=A0A9D4EQ15_DREPO|nr:hypothetical protein DPMN_162256 [Dreissena polymorpha]
MVVENENSVSFAEALGRLKEANSGFNPSSFMIDASEVEQNAIKMTFPGIKG